MRLSYKVTMKVLCTILVFFFIAQFSLAQSDSTVAVSGSDIVKKPVIAELNEYRITVPEGWYIKAGCVDASCMLLSRGDTLSSLDRFTENISVTISKLSNSKYTADQYADFSKGYLPKVVSNFTVLERKRLKFNKVLMVYRGKKDGFEQTWMQYYNVKNSKVYIVTCSIETKNYDYYRPIIKEYAETFEWK